MSGTSGYVYLIVHERGPVKIGWSSSPIRRCREIGKSCPYDLEVMALLRRGNGRILETDLHAIYRPRVRNNEWFDLTYSDVSTILSNVENTVKVIPDAEIREILPESVDKPDPVIEPSEVLYDY